MGTKPEPVDAQKGTMQDIFARFLKKNIAQVCTLLIHVLIVKRSFNLLYRQSYASIAEKSNIQKITVVTLLMYAKAYL
jgi:hypothetical protein